MTTTNATYPCKRTEVFTDSVPAGQVGFHIESPFQYIISNHFIIGTVPVYNLLGQLGNKPLSF